MGGFTEWLGTFFLVGITGLAIWATVSAAVAGMVYVIAMGLGSIFTFVVGPFWVFLAVTAAVVAIVFLLGASS